MQQNIREIDKIQFGIYSSEELSKIAVCTIDSSKIYNGNEKTAVNMQGTVYDGRLGPFDNGIECLTCKKNIIHCPGHVGKIILNEPVIHPLYYKQVISFLKCFCTKCYKLLLTEDQILLNGFNKLKGIKRFNKILEKLDKIDICSHCGKSKPDIKFIVTDSSIALVYKKKEDKISIVLQTDDIKKIFDNIDVKDVEMLGFDPTLIQPKNLIMTVFPVMPISTRPYVITDGNIYDDDLTIQLLEIIKANNHLETLEGVPNSDSKRQKYIQSLKFRISTFFNNSCLAPDTPVLLWCGKTELAKNIKVGDNLIGDDGKKRTVLETRQGVDEMYEISQSYGDSYTVNGNHILSLKYSGNKQIFWKNPNTKQKQGCWMVRWFDGYKVKTKYVSVTDKKTDDDAYEELKKSVDEINTPDIFDISVRDLLRLPSSTFIKLKGYKLEQPVDWKHKDVFIDPHILGLWLGDGDSTGRGFTTIDPEVVDYWKKWAELNDAEICLPKQLEEKPNLTYRANQVNDPLTHLPDIHYTIRPKIKGSKHPFIKLLDKYGLVNNKHIPDDYIYNSEEVRYKLLAGLIDTDGHVPKQGHIEFSQSIIRGEIVHKTEFLARSLGLNAHITSKTSRWIRNEKRSSEQVRIIISGNNVEKIPNIVPHKKCPKPKLRDTSSTGNIKIKPVGMGNYNGFIIDHNHRFLLKDFTSTHNSGRAKHPTNGRVTSRLK